MVARTRGIWLHAGLVAATTLAACTSNSGGDPGGSGPNPATLSSARAEPSGNGQSGTAGVNLPAPLRIVVVRGGTPAAGAVVTWSAIGTGAFMTPRVDTTGADGISSSIWHLGSELGPQSSQANVAGGADGSPVSFTATALGPGGAPAGVTIQLFTGGGNRFEPANVTVPAGTRVTWTWVDGFHDVVSGGNPTFPSSGVPVNPPSSYSFTFTTPGTFLYFCSVHGTLTTGMSGKIVVQ